MPESIIRAAAAFFGRLEGEADRAAQTVAVVLEKLGGAEKIGGVSVMTAGVHDAVSEGGVRAVEFFRQRQGVDVSAQQQRRARQFAADQSRDACTGDDFDVFNTHEGQFLENHLAGVKFSFAQFGMGVKIFPSYREELYERQRVS